MSRIVSRSRRAALACGALALASIPPAAGAAQVAPADPMMARIREEARGGSGIAEDLFQLTDAIGPRVVGSPALLRAEVWLTRRAARAGAAEGQDRAQPAAGHRRRPRPGSARLVVEPADRAAGRALVADAPRGTAPLLPVHERRGDGEGDRRAAAEASRSRGRLLHARALGPSARPLHTGTENVLAEIPGGDRADEVVLVGAHLDSWHGGTGATDNAAGVTALLEAVRILTALDAPLRRTVQVAFWGGEELGLAGSRAYVQRYLTDPKSGEPTDAWRKLSGYLNLDYGSGRIRGVYLQGNPRLKPLFDEWLAGIGDGTLVATLRTTLGSDQASLERVGIPGLSFIQDPLNYEQRTHHTTMDVPDYVLVDDVRDSAATLASLIYRMANADERLPRKTPR